MPPDHLGHPGYVEIVAAIELQTTCLQDNLAAAADLDTVTTIVLYQTVPHFHASAPTDIDTIAAMTRYRTTIQFNLAVLKNEHALGMALVDLTTLHSGLALPSDSDV